MEHIKQISHSDIAWCYYIQHNLHVQRKRRSDLNVQVLTIYLFPTKQLPVNSWWWVDCVYHSGYTLFTHMMKLRVSDITTVLLCHSIDVLLRLSLIHFTFADEICKGVPDSTCRCKTESGHVLDLSPLVNTTAYPL